MNDEPTNSSRSWLERLSQLLVREPNNRDELVEVLREAVRNKLLDLDALGMIEGVLQVSELQVRDVMIPRAQMVTVNQDASIQELLPTIIQSQHSRYPVIGENRDEVVGVLLAKDLLRYGFGNEIHFNMRDILRPVVFIPESKRLNVLLREFRLNRNHIAIVVDEYGGVAGLVTIEDVLEQIVGEIADEYDIDEEGDNIRKLNQWQYNVKALTPIADFNDYFNVAFSDEEFDTIGGFVLNKFGHLPKRGETVKIEDMQFKVLHADHRRILLLRVILPNKAAITA